MQLAPSPELVTRFASALDRLFPDGRLGLAVSGGSDSVALLLLAAAARPGRVEAATVDHGLRPGGAAEAASVARHCSQLQVPHATLSAAWDQPPQTAVQERARIERYRLLAQWVADRRLDGVATGHQMGDQAETFLMRLLRGAGVRGLGAMRPLARVPGGSTRLIRPLLGWTRAELEGVCMAAGVDTAADPGNADEQFERVRVRNFLAAADFLDPAALARSAARLGAADVAIDWATDREWEENARSEQGRVTYRPGSAPWEIRRRIVVRAIDLLATEGRGISPSGREVDQVFDAIALGGVATLRGVRCSGGEVWTFDPAPPRQLN